jgi:hypothetical protein
MATTITKTNKLAPGQKAEINIECLTVTRPAIQQVSAMTLLLSRRL